MKKIEEDIASRLDDIEELLKMLLMHSVLGNSESERTQENILNKVRNILLPLGIINPRLYYIEEHYYVLAEIDTTNTLNEIKNHYIQANELISMKIVLAFDKLHPRRKPFVCCTNHNWRSSFLFGNPIHRFPPYTAIICTQYPHKGEGNVESKQTCQKRKESKMVFIYLILGYWAAGRTIYANKIRIGTWNSLVMSRIMVALFLGWLLIPWAIIKLFRES